MAHAEVMPKRGLPAFAAVAVVVAAGVLPLLLITAEVGYSVPQKLILAKGLDWQSFFALSPNGRRGLR